MTSTWHDFFKVHGEYSQRNLTVFISIVVGSAVVIYMAIANTLTEGIFIGYMLAGGGVYSFGKWQDDKTSRSRIELDKPLPSAPTPAPSINMQVGAGQPGKIKDMNVEAEGDVVVATKPRRKRR